MLHDKKLTSIAAAVALLMAIAAPGCGSSDPPTVLTEREVREALLDELRPVALQNCTLSRFGGGHDSGLLMCKNLLEGVEAAYSYGIGGRDDWGCEVSMQYGVPVHQYDCLDTRRPACVEGYPAFHAECLGANTLANQIANNGDRGKRLVVRIDVEGKEWESLMQTPRAVFDDIEQLTVEFHGVNDSRFLDVVRRLKQDFHIVNVYFNNNACSADFPPMPAWAYQVLFVNRRVALIDPAVTGTPLPSPLNARDNPDLPDCQPEIPDRAARERHLRQQLLDELRPVALENCTLARFGSGDDGGYLMCENLISGLQTAYSYGVGKNDDWGCDVSTRYGVPVHQYDCFDPARPECKSGRFIFHDECIADRRERAYSRIFDTLANQIAANGDSGKRMIVKIDVEGAEWNALMATPDTLLQQIDQLPMELHGVNDARFLNVVRKLKRTFHLVNLHFNNFSCSPASAPLPGWAYQVLFVNKRLGVLDRARGTPPPSPLNAPDNRYMPDCQVDFTAR